MDLFISYPIHIHPGRIVNRFSGDVETMDSTLPLTLRTVIQSGGWVLEALINVGYSTPVVLTVVVPVIGVYMFLQVCHITV